MSRKDFISIEESFADRLRNRSNTKDRPDASKHCREAMSIQCKEKGHNHIFRPTDNYGCCNRCGDEVLT